MDNSTPLSEGEPTTIHVETAPPEKRRGPGRPKKEEAGTVPPNASEPAKKRGRPKGGKKVEPIDSDALAKQIAGLHIIVAQITQIPEIQISEPECQMLASSIANVCDEYDLSLDGKTGAFLQLAATAAFIYIPRVPVIKQRLALKKQESRNGIVETPEH